VAEMTTMAEPGSKDCISGFQQGGVNGNIGLGVNTGPEGISGDATVSGKGSGIVVGFGSKAISMSWSKPAGWYCTGKDHGIKQRTNKISHNNRHMRAPKNRPKKRLTSKIKRTQNDTSRVIFQSQSVKMTKISKTDIMQPFIFHLLGT